MCASRGPSLLGQVDRVGVGHRGVGEVQGGLRDVQFQRVPVRREPGDLGAAGPQRVEVLDREGHPGPGGNLREPGLEVPDVLALPQERRMHHHHLGPQRASQLGRPDQLGPGLSAPHPLGDQQARGVHRHDRQVVVLREAAQHAGVLADRVGRDHDLDAVVAQPGRELEGVSRALGEHRRSRQRDGHRSSRRHCAGHARLS